MNNKYSSFWDNSPDTSVDDFLGISDVNKPRGKDLVLLSGYRKAIGNFVNIVTERSDIPVTFNSNDHSCTDGKKVILGANLSEKNFDVAVGLALHEASHILLSDFNLLKQLEIEIPNETYLLGNNKNINKSEVLKLMKSVLNYLEDRRIDNYVFKSSPGYKGYYHSMYNKYFYSKNIDKGLLSSEFRMEDIESYLFRIINLHNKNRQLGALKGLREIYSLINFNSISRFNNTREVFNTAVEVCNVIVKSIDKIKFNSETETGNKNSEESNDEDFGKSENNDSDVDSGSNSDVDSGSNSDVDSGSDDGYEDAINNDGSEPTELSDKQKKLLEKAVKNQKKFLDGDIKKTKISKKDGSLMKSLEKSGTTYENVGDGISYFKGTKCLVVKKLTRELIDSNVFSCAGSSNKGCYNSAYRKYNFVEEGLRLGKVLGKKLKVRGENKELKYSRKNSGKIDKRLISELGFDNKNIFSQTFIEKYNKAYLHISIDASSSMSGKKWNKAMTSAIAMIKACDMAGNIDVIVSIRSTHRMSNRDIVPLIIICYDSRIDKLSKVKNLFQSLSSSGTTPEGLCFEAIIKNLIPGNSNQDSYFINYSDGAPYFNNKDILYGGDYAASHTNKMVNKMLNMGLKVISYFIGDNVGITHCSSMFKRMYGKNSIFINPVNMMDVARNMNQRFIQK